MRFTLDALINSIAGVLKGLYPNAPVYSNPNQQGTVLPCFFVFFTSLQVDDEMDRRSRRVLGLDIIYLTERNIPDAYDLLISVADTLDAAFGRLQYSDGSEQTLIKTFDREWKIDDGELHYQFTLKVIGSAPRGLPVIKSMESYEGGIKDV